MKQLYSSRNFTACFLEMCVYVTLPFLFTCLPKDKFLYSFLLSSPQFKFHFQVCINAIYLPASAISVLLATKIYNGLL
jgi:hypothetical protein